MLRAASDGRAVTFKLRANTRSATGHAADLGWSHDASRALAHLRSVPRKRCRRRSAGHPRDLGLDGVAERLSRTHRIAAGHRLHRFGVRLHPCLCPRGDDSAVRRRRCRARAGRPGSAQRGGRRSPFTDRLRDGVRGIGTGPRGVRGSRRRRCSARRLPVRGVPQGIGQESRLLSPVARRTRRRRPLPVDRRRRGSGPGQGPRVRPRRVAEPHSSRRARQTVSRVWQTSPSRSSTRTPSPSRDSAASSASVRAPTGLRASSDSTMRPRRRHATSPSSARASHSTPADSRSSRQPRWSG